MKGRERRKTDTGSREKRKKKKKKKNAKFSLPSTTSEGNFACVVRDQKPEHYMLKIQSFSLLKEIVAQDGDGRYESQKFNVGSHEWKLAIYPNGDEIRNGANHISMYLVSADDSILATNLEVNVRFTFLLYNHVSGKYLSFRDGKVSCFHAPKIEWGFPKLLSLDIFTDASNGLLVDDCCVFGVDIFIMECDAQRESLSFIKEPPNNKFTWKINSFSQLDKTLHESDSFEVGGYWWKISVFPGGCPKAKIGFLSLYLTLCDDFKQLPKGSQVYGDYEMTILNQSKVGSKEETYKCWFEFGGANSGWGNPNFILLSDLKEPKNGFIKEDTAIVEVKMNVVSNLEPPNNKFIWKINNFSQLDKLLHESDSFEVGGYRWKIYLFPRGCPKAENEFLSLYLTLPKYMNQLPKGSQVYGDYEMIILNQSRNGSNERTHKCLFEYGDPNKRRGNPNFISLSDLKKPKNGFIKDDIVIVEVKMNVVSNLERFP